jgi:hypothetical protein
MPVYAKTFSLTEKARPRHQEYPSKCNKYTEIDAMRGIAKHQQCSVSSNKKEVSRPYIHSLLGLEAQAEQRLKQVLRVRFQSISGLQR